MSTGARLSCARQISESHPSVLPEDQLRLKTRFASNSRLVANEPVLLLSAGNAQVEQQREMFPCLTGVVWAKKFQMSALTVPATAP